MTSTKARKTKPVGSISLVAAGPGDPELLTARALRLIGEADVVVPDVDVLDIARLHFDDEAIVSVVDDDGLPIDNAARAKKVVEQARMGHNVVRLIAGDPVADGTIAVEGAVISRSKLPFEVAPGVSPITGLGAYVGFPLIGGKATQVRVVQTADVQDWAELADPSATLIVSDGAERAVEISKALVAAGRKPDTPVVISRATTTVEQRTLASTLGELPAAVKASKLAGPGTLVVGEVLNNRDKLSWFETKPLFGWRVLVPRTKEQSAGVVEHLKRYGAVPVEVPTISVEPPRTPQQMDRAIQGLVTGRYQWVVFTSANAVKAIREKFEEYGLDARAMAGLKVAAVGEQTAGALIAFGVKPELVPEGEQSSAGLLEVWQPYDAELDPIDRVFLPRADIATEQLVAGMQELGWEVDDITAYRTVRAAPPPAHTREAIKTGGFDAVLFTSSSTVRNLVGIAGKPHASTVVACIGPKTAKTAEEHGLRVDVLATTPNVIMLADELAVHAEALRLASLERGEQTWRPSRRRGGSRRRKTNP